MDGLHVADIKEDIVLYFLLTSPVAGVKHTRSLTVSQFSQLVLSPGLKPGRSSLLQAVREPHRDCTIHLRGWMVRQTELKAGKGQLQGAG